MTRLMRPAGDIYIYIHIISSVRIMVKDHVCFVKLVSVTWSHELGWLLSRVAIMRQPQLSPLPSLAASRNARRGTGSLGWRIGQPCSLVPRGWTPWLNSLLVDVLGHVHVGLLTVCRVEEYGNVHLFPHKQQRINHDQQSWQTCLDACH